MPHPQAVQSDRMPFEDAAFIPRPHTAASVSKGAANAIALTDALIEHNHDVPSALNAWETEQLRLGMHLWKVGQDLGERSQFMYGTDRFEEPIGITSLASIL